MATLGTKVVSGCALSSLLGILLFYAQYNKNHVFFPESLGNTLQGFTSYLISFVSLPLIRYLYTYPESYWDEERHLPVLQRPVDIYRDNAGIPYIFANSWGDAQCAFAFVEYTERPFQYELLRRLANGTMAETFGEELLQGDMFARSAFDEDLIEETIENFSPEERRHVEHIVSAIDHAAKNLPAKPVEFALLGWTYTPWTMMEYLKLNQAIALILARGFTIDFVRSILEKELGDYWKSFDLQPSPHIPPVSLEGEKPVLLDLNGKHVQLPLYSQKEDTWARTRPVDYQKILEKLAQKRALSERADAQREADDDGRGKAGSSFTFSTSAGAGSNAWAVSGRYTKSGKPLLAGDPHLMSSISGFWIPALLSVGPSKLLTSGGEKGEKEQGEEPVRITGVSPVGASSIMIGHNGNAAWSQTISHVDADDLFLVKMDPTGTKYLYDGKWWPLKLKTEHFTVKGGKEKVTRILRATHHGSLFSDIFPELRRMLRANEALALASISLRSQPNYMMGSFLARAKTWKDFIKLGIENEQVQLTTVWATTEGDIGSTVSGAIPVRALPKSRHLIRDGSLSSADWNGVLPISSIANLMNPKEGFVVAANWRLSADPKALYGHVYVPGERYQRAREFFEELVSSKVVDVEDMVELQQDTVFTLGREFRDYALRTILFAYAPEEDGQKKQSRKLAHTIQSLCAENGLSFDDGQWLYYTIGQWDASMESDSIEATVHEVWNQWLLQEVFKRHDFSEESLEVVLGFGLNSVWLRATEILNHWRHNLLRAIEKKERIIEDVGTPEELLCRSAALALRWLRLRYGNDPSNWKWGSVRSRFLEHPLGAAIPLLRHTVSRGPLKWGGNFGTINNHHVKPQVLSMEDLTSNAFSDSLACASMKMVVDLGNLKRSVWSVYPGVSGWVGSPHYDDMMTSPESNGPAERPMLWTDEEIEAAAVTHMRLLPTDYREAVTHQKKEEEL